MLCFVGDVAVLRRVVPCFRGRRGGGARAGGVPSPWATWWLIGAGGVPLPPRDPVVSRGRWVPISGGHVALMDGESPQVAFAVCPRRRSCRGAGRFGGTGSSVRPGEIIAMPVGSAAWLDSPGRRDRPPRLVSPSAARVALRCLRCHVPSRCSGGLAPSVRLALSASPRVASCPRRPCGLVSSVSARERGVSRRVGASPSRPPGPGRARARGGGLLGCHHHRRHPCIDEPTQRPAPPELKG